MLYTFLFTDYRFLFIAATEGAVCDLKKAMNKNNKQQYSN